MSTYAKIVSYPEELRLALRLQFSPTVIAAGEADSLEGFDEEVDLYEHLVAHPDSTYALRVTGDSMDDDEIHNGDLILVDRQIEATASSIVVMDVDGRLTVKKFSRVGNRLFLIPGNKNFKPKEIYKEQHCEVWGVVTHVIHKV